MPSRAKATKATAASRADGPKRRKLIAFDEATWNALDLYARDSMHTFQELAGEAFDDPLKKDHRPLTLKDALKQSVRRHPANDPGAKTGR